MSEPLSQPGVAVYFDNGSFLNVLVSYETFCSLLDDAEKADHLWLEIPTYADSADMKSRPIFRESIRLSRILRVVEIPDDLIALREAEVRAAALLDPPPFAPFPPE